MSDELPEYIPYPWQQQSWQCIQQQISSSRIPQALLLSGQQGIGKLHFAQLLARYLLCLSPKVGLACGQCRSCHLISANTHPDKKNFSTEGVNRIKIDQIRELSVFISKTSQQGGKRKVVILGPVEQLNINSANALLKNLEEPAGDTILILTTHVLSAVIDTIRSRCQLIPLLTPSRSMAIEWLIDSEVKNREILLEFSGGAPLTAKNMFKRNRLKHLQLFVNMLEAASYAPYEIPHIVSSATRCLSLNVVDLTGWWIKILHSIMLIKNDKCPLNIQHEVDELGIARQVNRILEVGRGLNKRWLFKFNDKLLILRKQQLQGANPNIQLLIEELLLDWQVIVQRASLQQK